MPRRPVRIPVTGSRTWTDKAAIAQAISNYLHSVGTNIGSAWPFPVIVHGAARGTDQLADAAALDPEPHPADSHHYDRAAGYRHNAAMVALGADVCLAFILDDSAGAATPPPSPKPPASPPAATSTGADDHRVCRRAEPCADVRFHASGSGARRACGRVGRSVHRFRAFACHMRAVKNFVPLDQVRPSAAAASRRASPVLAPLRAASPAAAHSETSVTRSNRVLR